MVRGGQRKSLADLTGSVGDHSPVDGLETRQVPPPPATTARLADLVANPHNPREVGDLSDLASIAVQQLQPVLVVTRAAYLRLYPDEAAAIGAARWVVVTGSRRLAAAREYGRENLDIVVKDEVAADRATFIWATIDENIGRRDFDVLEEAHAVEQLVTECGGIADDAADRLNRSKGWVSQRRALLKLAPELQEALRRGELAIRVARSLARVPREEQVARWQAEQERATKQPDTAPKPEAKPKPASVPRLTKALRRFEPAPVALAEALWDYLDADQVGQLTARLDELGGRR
ncbi:ParB family chromosome partitioning protein [Nocardia transvalensis]|uniref:ParB family chromosome partitioning protein n=1 Tax=Nocardia transvalensis TaxID=37333 RepID=A0A7W9UMS9_9NOCA|nr:ParB/RepB/Spo0J family partition protein [Nocardia transvalensis]MBB5918948.1 ParB family chromosome partitioning protein [Nocardia transvalensis]